MKEEIDSDTIFFNPGWFSSELHEFYKLEDEGDLPRDVTNPDSIIQIFISLDSLINSRSRSIYNVLDFLGDIGGLFDALKLIAEFMVFLLGNRGVSMFLIGKLFYFPISLAARTSLN